MSIKRQESGYVDNWQGRETLTECNLRMLETEDFSDVTFRVGSQQQVVRAHRYVLVSRSCVFHAMFCGPLAEKGEVTIPDIEADIFKEFLRYMYTDEARINAETVTGLMYTSRKYSLDTLYDLCVTFLEESLSEDNVCQILEECHGYGELDLEQKALKILTEGGERVTKSPGFVGLCSECVGKLLKSDTLNLKEKDIFEAVLSWTKERCRKEGVSDTPENRRRLLGDMRYEIRFTSLSLEYLVKVVGPSGLLTAEERVRIMDRAFDSTVDISPFVGLKRKHIQEPDICKYVQRFATVSHVKDGVAGSHSLSFSVNHRIQLKGCQLYGGYDDLEVPVSISLYDQDESEITELDTEMELLGRGQMTDILFSESVLLQPGTTYIVCVEIDVLATEEGPYWGQWEQGGYIGLNGKQTVTTDGVQFTFSNSRYYNTETTALRGNIPGFIFSI
ncbi:BTB/POZ domain-containing protein 6-like isoform X1 [Haliotis rubra]|uniref:BTB/POZ domain-containing protein 6-like isoform X1 n=1 Tax=Haliotis rubra TaxID=36100 RepID=UPI001EE4EED2|nr:BTB/POZ domain-containing protein 6-like isoform X1 [Haliotis rubra]